MEEPTILIVEDEWDTVEMYRIVLEVEGYHVMVAYTLQAAIKQLEKKRPDLVLLDVALRGSSGLDLCEKIRNDPIIADIPVVIISNLDSPEDIEAGLAAGANAYLTKPISQDELLEAVRANLAPR
jgi:two-component system phosphate regulon response regulator PhoB